MRRRRTNINKPREKRTLIPAFDPGELAKTIEDEANRTTVQPPFDPSSYYARIAETGGVERAAQDAARDTPRVQMAALPADESDERPGTISDTPPASAVAVSATDETLNVEDTETIGREMYGCYLASDFPEALVLAERVLQLEPEHALAQLVAKQCKERLTPSARTLSPSSVLRLKIAELEKQSRHIDPTTSFVLGHIDGVSDAATVAALTGLSDGEAMARLHALLDLGVLEVVSA